MALEIVTVPCLEDNYAYVIGNTETGEAAVVDVPEAAPIAQAVKARGWRLTTVLLTHHHWDHVDGLSTLDPDGILRVFGAKADAHRLPPLTQALEAGETFTLLDHPFTVWDVSGHTVGHIAFLTEGYAFTGDSLMALGCGRLFEGTPAQMLQSLTQFDALPPKTLICSGHEYTQSNARFALTIEPENPDLIARMASIEAARAAGTPTVPSVLGIERATNPFLRAHLAPVQAAVGASDAVSAFTEIRARKDRF